MVARSASLAYRNQGATAAALGVAYVVEGSVQREGRRLRVGTRVTDAEGRILWADRFEVKLDGLFELQDRIVAQFAETLINLTRKRTAQ